MTPALSVLIPFYKESPLSLLKALSTGTPEAVEIILLDDGSNQPELTAEVEGFLAQSSLRSRLITLTANQGRAKGRNRLTDSAHGQYFLFLDSDMLPDAPDFLDRWVEVTRENPAVVFGGFSLRQAPTDPAFAVHSAMAGHSDCLSAAERSQMPEKYVFTSNLLVRRDVFGVEDFDNDFTGWGWEDVEWAMRVAARFDVRHIDNTATHMGLDTVDSLIRKYTQSVPNFARVLKKHPEVISTYNSYRVARKLKHLPGLSLVRAGAKAAARTDVLPVKARAFALRLYRASLYAEVV